MIIRRWGAVPDPFLQHLHDGGHGKTEAHGIRRVVARVGVGLAAEVNLGQPISDVAQLLVHMAATGHFVDAHQGKFILGDAHFIDPARCTPFRLEADCGNRCIDEVPLVTNGQENALAINGTAVAASVAGVVAVEKIGAIGHLRNGVHRIGKSHHMLM